MKYLRIEQHKGFVRTKNQEKQIDDITKGDIVFLIETLIETEENFEMDEFNAESIQHGVHKIIYKHLYDKLIE